MISTLTGKGDAAAAVKKSIAIFTYTVPPSDPNRVRKCLFESHTATVAVLNSGYTELCSRVELGLHRAT